MKKTRIVFVLAVLLVALTACVYYDDTSEQIVSQPTTQLESSIPLDVATDLFSQMQAIWDADDGELWGFHLQAPFIIADPITRHAVANMPDPHGYFQRSGDIYVGVLPDHVFISHTIREFAGITWAMMAWEPFFDELIASDPDFLGDLLRLMIHEGFHAVQFYKVVDGELGFNISFDFLNNSADARIAVLMEAEALATAVRSEGDERLQAIHDALSIRTHRRATHPEATINENAQEINEGLALFTEILAFGCAISLVDNYLGWVTAGAESTGLSSYPYFTGAAYAVLLMEAGVNWQTGITFETDLAESLKEALNVEITPFDQLDLERWGYSKIVPAQRDWVLRYQKMLEGAETFVEQPHLLILGDNFMDGATMVSLEIFNIQNQNTGWWYMVQYGEFTLISLNWQLIVSDGFTSPSWYPSAGVFVRHYENTEISEDGSRATSPTWTLEITNPAYEIQITESGEILAIQR
ncbi:MAG: hypothetical protein FWD97_00875 [Defluviitaleaceae bacterium]|nr:hypothetical protein [Defluviitaleaceae bacterium]